jgi:hypothetical protein
MNYCKTSVKSPQNVGYSMSGGGEKKESENSLLAERKEKRWTKVK